MSSRGGRDEPVPERFGAQIGNQLRRERRLAGLSREALAKSLRVTPKAVEAYEKGEEWLSASRLAAAVACLGIPLSMLFADDAPARLRSDGQEHERWIALSRPLGVLRRPDFSQAAPLVSLWYEKRGEMTAVVEDTLLMSGLLHRTIILRRPPRSARLLTHHFGSFIVFVRPADILGRDIQDLPDSAYGELVAEAYDEALRLGAPIVQAVRAIIRAWDGKTIGARYDRVLMPWRWRGADQFAMCISLRRGQLVDMDSTAVLPP